MPRAKEIFPLDIASSALVYTNMIINQLLKFIIECIVFTYFSLRIEARMPHSRLRVRR